MKKKVVNTILKKCLGHKKKERLLIVCDDRLEGLARTFYKEAGTTGVPASLLEIPPQSVHGEEPPAVVAEALKAADIALLFTSMSMSHTVARKEASHKYNTRIASMPGITEEILGRSICLSYSLLSKKVKRVSGLLTRARMIRVTTKKGTCIEMSVKGRKGFSDNGIYTRKGAFGNLPAGEACIAPCEGTANGRIVVDASAPLVGRIKYAKEIIVKDGYAQNIPFPEIAAVIKKLGRSARNIAELGIGLNPKARVTGNILEDEKAEKTVHIAIGDNRSFGGNISCPCHLDFVLFDPTVIIDGVRLWI